MRGDGNHFYQVSLQVRWVSGVSTYLGRYLGTWKEQVRRKDVTGLLRIRPIWQKVH